MESEDTLKVVPEETKAAQAFSEEAFVSAFRSIQTIAFVGDDVVPVFDWKFPSAVDHYLAVKQMTDFNVKNFLMLRNPDSKLVGLEMQFTKG